MSKSEQTPDSDARMSGFRQDILAHFHDREYRHAYVDEFLNTTIASQIRALREQRGWTQAELATRAGTGQSRISELENVNYESWTISSLRALAEAFDVALAVCFKGFTARLADIERFSQVALGVPSYADDLFLSIGAPAPPKLADTSPLVPLLGNLAQVVAHFNAGSGPANAPDLQQNVVALMAAVEQMYGNDSRQYREFAEWRAGFVAALRTAAQKREEQATAQFNEIDEKIRRLTEENRAIREQQQRDVEAAQREAQLKIEAARLAAALEIERVRADSQRVTDVLRQKAEQIAAGIAAQREAISRLTTTIITTNFDDLVSEALSQGLRQTEHNLRDVEQRVEELVHT